jgi:hypothetical protein
MIALIPIRDCAKSAAVKTRTAKANAATAAPDSACNGLGSQSAATKTASTNATAAETTTETSSVEATATTKATTGRCRLTKRNETGAYQAK